MDGAVPFAWRSQTKLPGGSQQKPVLLLRLWPRRRCDSLCRALSPGAVPASPGTAAPLAWRDAFTAGSCEFLWHAVTPSCRGGCLSAAPRTPLAGTDRAHAHRLRAGRCLRGWLTQLGYPLPALRQAGLVSAVGYDTYMHRVVFPLAGNLYGRSLSTAAPPHRFLPGTKGGLYLWEQVRQCSKVILVEGLFDYAVLWQAGFCNVTCALGNRLNAHQFRQLCDGRARTVYVTFDADRSEERRVGKECRSR